ncbi:MAG: signal recognition particle-docking protein FtsY [Lentisphaerae bacterium]|jgi:fused signal recognition particle receptor|nr:signal recognition particle-docking protein FtsY [Lentisphaerota bacterium]
MASILQFFQRGLQKTKTSLVRGFQGLFGKGGEKWTAETYEQLEAALIGTDLGYEITDRLVSEIRDRYERGLIETSSDIMAVGREVILDLLQAGEPASVHFAETGPTVIMLVGVNGSGKTTSAAKLAHYFMQQGKKVLLGAGDTFRAAGIEQLQIWGERLGCPVVGGKQGGDAAAVAYDAVSAGRQRGMDVVIIDTAGRQHTRADLMNELAKVKRVISKEMPDAPHEIWLTVDASIGTNALIQAREFGKLFPLTGLILTKLDGTGKGGVVVAIRRELGYPVQFVGLGEQMDDLQPFDPESYVQALFE